MRINYFIIVLLALALTLIPIPIPIPNANGSITSAEQGYESNIFDQSANRTEYIGQTLTNIAFDFYQVSEVIFIGNKLVNVSIAVNSVANVTIIGNEFTDTTGVSILIWDSTDVIIESNVFVDVPEVAIFIIETTGAIVRKNNISLAEESFNPWALLVGINIDRSPNTLVTLNDVYSPLGDGVYIHSSKNTFVSNNIIHHTGFVSLSIVSSDNTMVMNNSIIDSSSYQLSSSDKIPTSSAIGISNSPGVVIRNNLIDYSDSIGIDIVSSNNVEIANNTIINHEISGIFLGLTNDAIVRDNIFYNNGFNIETDQVSNLITENNSDSSDSPVQESKSRTINAAIDDGNPTPIYLMLLVVSVLLIGFVIQKKLRKT